jgi:site-specific recombinase XerD
MSHPSRVRISGPLVSHTAGFRAALEAQGYRHHAVGCQLYVMAHLSRWLEAEELEAADLTPDRIERFLVARREAGYTLWLSTKGVAPLVGYLRGVGVVPLPEPVVAVTLAERCLDAFRTYLVEERGLSEGTVAADVHVARLFLATRPAEDLGLEQLTPGEVVEFVRGQCEGRGSAYVTAGLRAFLRFCHVTGLIVRPLVDAVPKVASSRLATLPKAVDPPIVAALLASCDRRMTYGRRDFAVLMLLARLGLRAGEVTSLRLEDIDWRAGEILIRGKGPRLERLPLPADVGEAVAAWLRRGRPRCQAREVITRVRAPHGPLTAGGVAALVHAACLRAGVDHINAHRLRHTAATEMLRAGAGLAEIGQVLRHRSLLTTAIYAKVDRAGLRELASPWPGSSPQAVK